MPLDQAQKAKQNLYEDTVIHYMSKEDGHVIVLSDDQAFSTQLRLTLAKELGLSSPNMLTALSDPHQLLRILREVTPKHPAPMLFLERKMNGQDLSFLVNQIKQAYNKLRIIILTSDVQRDRLMLLHEVGADNFIAKPVSVNTLIEKMAFTLKPQSKLGQAIDKAKELLAQKQYPEALVACQKILELKPGSSAAIWSRRHAARHEWSMTRRALPMKRPPIPQSSIWPHCSAWRRCTANWTTKPCSCVICKSWTPYRRST